MYLLDTDHIALLHCDGKEGKRIARRLAQIAPEEVAISMVTFEEQLQGCLGEINRVKGASKQQKAYERLERLRQHYSDTPLLSFDEKALVHYRAIWPMRFNLSTMDVKIAAIALANDATLLTCRTFYFGRIAQLKLDDWSIYKKYACPCCGYKTIRYPPANAWEWCEICDWETNPLQFKDPDYEGGPNHMSLRQGQQDFLHRMFPLNGANLGREVRPTDERDANWRPLPPR